MELVELIALVLLAGTSVVQHGERVPYPRGKGDWAS